MKRIEPGLQEAAGASETPRAREESWRELRAASTTEAFCAAWLALQCGVIPDVLGGLVLTGPPDRGPFSPAAVWPRVHGDMKPLTAAAERVLEERCGMVLQPQAEGSGGRARFEIAQPLEVEGALHGVVVLDVSPRPEPELAWALEQLRWGAAWLELCFRRQQDRSADTRTERLQTLLELVAAVAERDRFGSAATHFATEMATRLGCDRVSIGFLRRGRVVLRALSHSAQFGKKTNLVRAIEAAMDEVAEQEGSIVYPDPSGSEARVVRAHGELCRQFGSGTLCSVPLVSEGRVCGVMTLERVAEQPFDEELLALCEAAAALAGPMLELQRREDRWWIARDWEALRGGIEKLTGPRHVALKLIAGALGALLLFLSFARGDYRVTARVTLEPEEQRAAVAPFDGYLAEASVRAGDRVTEGQLLARLDDRDLSLERLRLLSQLEQQTKQNRQALADRDAAEARILSARIDQVQAQLDLVEDRLARTQVRAPFDGVVVQGDLSQSLGAPLERGVVLFEIAPLDAYRVVLQVDESDIREVAVGQEGRLVLAATPGAPIGFTVTKITPVSTAEEGRNTFRAEAELEHTPERLRPGMEGVGKIEIDRRRLIWIWTHTGIDWLRLALWRWLP